MNFVCDDSNDDYVYYYYDETNNKCTSCDAYNSDFHTNGEKSVDACLINTCGCIPI